MMVDCFRFGEVHWVTCVQSVLCEGWCSYITILHGPLMLYQSMFKGLAGLSYVYTLWGMEYTTPLCWSSGKPKDPVPSIIIHCMLTMLHDLICIITQCSDFLSYLHKICSIICTDICTHLPMFSINSRWLPVNRPSWAYEQKYKAPSPTLQASFPRNSTLPSTSHRCHLCWMQRLRLQIMAGIMHCMLTTHWESYLIYTYNILQLPPCKQEQKSIIGCC